MLALLLLTSTALADSLEFIYHWEETPSVHICPDATINENDVSKAVEFWKSEGINVKIKGIKKVSYCSSNSENVIQIMGDRDVRSSEYAATVIDWYYYGSQNQNTVYYINRAKVQIPEGTVDKIMFHEIGHALGLGHSQHRVMYAYH